MSLILRRTMVRQCRQWGFLSEIAKVCDFAQHGGMSFSKANLTRLERCFWIMGLAALAALFGWLVYQSSFFSDNFDLIIIRDCDDIGFQKILQAQRELLRAHHWGMFLANNDSGYGNIFWSPLALISLAFHDGVGPWARPLILFPREISLIAYFLCFYLFYKIARARGISANGAFAGVLMIATCASPMSLATRFHNYTILAALVLAALLQLARPRTRRRLIAATVFFAVAVGLKFTALFAAPVFWLFLNYDLGWPKSDLQIDRTIRENTVPVAGLLLIAPICYAPTILVWPWYHYFEISVGALRAAFAIGQNVPLQPSYAEILSDRFLPAFYHGTLWIAVLIGLSAAVLMSVRQRRWPSLFIVTAWLCAILLVAMAIRMRPIGHAMYAHSIFLVLILSLSFTEITRLRGGTLALVCLALLNIGLNFAPWYEQLTRWSRIVYEADTRRDLMNYEKYKTAVSLRPDDNVLGYFRAVFPYGQLTGRPPVKFFFNGEEFDPAYNVLIFSRYQILWSADCPEAYRQQGLSPVVCQQLKNAMAGTPPYKILYKDDNIEVVRRDPLAAAVH